MGVSYSVYLVYGFELKEKDCKIIIEPAVFEDQNRYDFKTGVVSHKETILVKQEKFKYVFGNIEQEGPGWYEFLETVSNKLKLKAYDDNRTGTAVVGKLILENKDWGRFDAPKGSISLNAMSNLHTEVLGKLALNNIEIDPSELKLRVVTYVG